MVIWALLLIFSYAKYGFLLSEIRSYIKLNDQGLFEKYHLDWTGLMLSQGEAFWKFQMFVMKRKYISVKDEGLVSLCDKAYRWGVATLVMFFTIFAIAVFNGVVKG